MLSLPLRHHKGKPYIHTCGWFTLEQRGKEGRNHITNVPDQKKRRQNQGQSMRRWPWSAQKTLKRRSRIPNISKWKYFYYIRHWCTWDTGCGDHRYTRRSPTCGFRRAYHHGIETKTCSINVSQKVYYIRQERQTRYKCENFEVPIRTATEYTSISPQIGQRFIEIWT